MPSPGEEPAGTAAPPVPPTAAPREPVAGDAAASAPEGVADDAAADARNDAGTGASSRPLGENETIPEVPLEYWEQLSEGQRQTVYKGLDHYYTGLLDELLALANEAVESYTHFGSRHTGWRIMLIVFTGVLAMVNVLATGWPDKWDGGVSGVEWRAIFSFAAALLAVLLALLTNIDSFLNFGEKRANSRDTRELCLDAYREFEMLRLTSVFPYGFGPQACYNLNRLYKKLAARDAELRRKIRRQSDLGAKSGSGAAESK